MRIALFFERYMHSRPLLWLDTELKRMLGIDVYQYPFPVKQGYTAIRQGSIDLLVLRCEETDAVKERAIAQFVGLDDFAMVRSDVTARKGVADHYARFRQQIRFPREYLDRMYGSKYARHFYGEDQLKRFRQRWRGDAAEKERGDGT